MSRFAMSLRVLLAIVLVLNGIGSAVASVPMAHGGNVTMEMPVSDSVEMPCHRGHDAQAGAAHRDVVSALAEEERSPPDSHCCKSGACRCTCMHQAQAAVAVLLPIDAVIIHTRPVLPLEAGHSAPALPNLIRPPIG